MTELLSEPLLARIWPLDRPRALSGLFLLAQGCAASKFIVITGTMVCYAQVGEAGGLRGGGGGRETRCWRKQISSYQLTLQYLLFPTIALLSSCYEQLLSFPLSSAPQMGRRGATATWHVSGTCLAF